MRRKNSRLSLFAALVVALLLVSLLAGCAFFNAFYNTRRNFREAEKERERTTNMNAQPAGYAKAIESGGRLLEFYPDSKYIDDALMIMGQSYYWTKDYHKAKRKFEELIANYPDSPYYEQARLWLGKTLVAMKNRQEATSTLRGLLADTDDPTLTSDALFALAELYFLDSLFTKATEEFASITETTDDPVVLGKAYWRAGETAFRQKNFTDAVRYLKSALDYELTRTLRFRTTFLYGRALYETGEYKKAIDVFRDLLKDKRYFEEHGKVRVYLALAEQKLGNEDESLRELQRVIDDHARSEEAAQAYYERALYALHVKGDRESAKTDLDKARAERAGTLYSMKADSLLKTLNRVDDLSEKRAKTVLRIAFTEKWIAEPEFPGDSSFTQTSFYDSLAIDSLRLIPLWSRAWRDSFPPVETPDSASVPEDSATARKGVSSLGGGAETLSADSSVISSPDSAVAVPANSPAIPFPDSTAVTTPGKAGTIDSSAGLVQPGRSPRFPIRKPPSEASPTMRDSTEPRRSTPLAAREPVTTGLRSPRDSSRKIGIVGSGELLFPGVEPAHDSSAVAYDSLSSDSTRQNGLKRTAAADSVQRSIPPPVEPIRVFDPTPVFDSLAVMKAQLQDIRFQLAEILLFDLSEPDSAVTVFRELANPPNADSVRARALLALANIAETQGDTLTRDSLITMLAADFAGTAIGDTAAVRLGRPLLKKPSKPDEVAFYEAEDMFFSGDTVKIGEAYSQYRWIVETYPESPFAPKALYAAAVIAGDYLNDGETARELLLELQDEYSSSDQAIRAGEQLAEWQAILNREAMSDSTALEPTEEELRAYSEEELDEPPQMVGGQETLANILEARGLLPQEVISGTGGEVKLRYIIKADGHAYNFRVAFEDPPGKGLARALTAALEEVTFTPGKLNGENVDTRVERRYTLPLDAPPNVRPLPRRFRN